MDDFIRSTSSKVGVDESQARNVIGQVLGFMKDNAPKDFDFNGKVASQIPGVEKLMAEVTEAATAADAGGGGEGEQQRETAADDSDNDNDNDLLKPCMPILDMLKELVAKFFGDDAARSLGEGAALTQIMAQSGVSPEQGASMVQKLVAFLEEKVGSEQVRELTDKIPAVRKFIGTGGGATTTPTAVAGQ